MRSSRVRKPAIGVSLFPFLAVLICTMGALIVLLIMVVQQARVQAHAETREQAAAPADGPSAEELQHEKEDYEWRREMLEKQRAELTQKLADERLELGHLDDHIRRLQDQWKRLIAQSEELNRAGENDPADASIAAEQARLKQVIEQAKKYLDESQKKLSTKKRSFAIIPYKGPNGTYRRPIYIECRGDVIIFQPEGVKLTAADFDGPLGPGNPFDAALRATREYLASGGGNQGGEPYPLLVVRPDGAVAYALARAAMKSWDDEFGYELIDQDMKLAFPPPDPQLASTLQRTLGDARRRQELLAKVAPSRFKGVGSRGRGSGGDGDGVGFNEHYGVGAGGEQGDGSGPGGSGNSRFPGGNGTGGSGGNSPGTGTGSLAKGGGTGGLGGTGSGGLGGTGSGPGGTGLTGVQGSGNGGSGGTGGFYGSEPPIGKPGTTPGGGNLGGTGSGNSSTGSVAGGNGAAGPNGTGPGGTGSGDFADGGAAGGSGVAGSSKPGAVKGASGAQFASASARGTSGGSSGGGSSGGSAGATGGSGTPGSGGGGGSSQGQQGGMPNLQLGEQPEQEQSTLSDRKPSKARRRSSNWGLPNSSQDAVGYTRPIRVTCTAEKLVILPERGGKSSPQIVRLANNTPAPIEDFVGAVWKHMEGWGIAGQRAYWKPVLTVQVAPGGEERFAELESQLKGSGLEVKRK